MSNDVHAYSRRIQMLWYKLSDLQTIKMLIPLLLLLLRLSQRLQIATG